MMQELAFAGISLEVYRPRKQELTLHALSLERYQDVPPPAVSLRGISFEQHRFRKRRRLFKKQWWS